MQVDFLIIGQGIAGTFLHYYLTEKGFTTLVIDNNEANTASKIASGVINPVTGRRLATTWMIETIMPFAVEAYSNISKKLHITNCIEQKNTINFFPTPQMQLAFEERLADNAYIEMLADTKEFLPFFNFPFKVGIVKPCYWIHVNALLEAYKQYLITENLLVFDTFNEAELQHNPNGIIYKNIAAKKVLYCNGIQSANSQYFSKLPFAKNKGEAIIVEINNIPTNYLYKMGFTLVPWQQNTWWIGSTYEWEYANNKPTDTFRKKVEDSLQYWLKTPYKIIDHFAAERPANLERRPFVGLHPIFENIGILNGLGTKGCSLAPFFANELANCITNQKNIEPLANVQRFKNILSK